MNFDMRTRFRGSEYDLATGLVAAAGGWSVRPGAQRRPWQRLQTAVLKWGARAFPALARRVHQHRSGVSVEDFRRAAEAVTGQPLTYTVEDDMMRCASGDVSWVYPRSDAKQVFFGFMTAVGPERWLGAKYTLPGFVELEPGDVVVDCGAFVGGFTRAALAAGASVIAVEPSRRNRRCLEENLRGYEVDIQGVGLGEECGKLEFQEASTGVDSTFVRMDEGVPVESYPVEVLTLDELIKRSGLSATFVKIEAEGMELKVLEGMREMRPAKIAVDASPEGGSSDMKAIVRALEAAGYSVRRDVNMVYGRRFS